MIELAEARNPLPKLGTAFLTGALSPGIAVLALRALLLGQDQEEEQQ